jgi:Tol biopolymer transport system component
MTRRRPIRLTTGAAVNPVWSPDGKLIVYAGPNVSAFAPLLPIKPDGTPVDLPRILLRRDGERVRFTPDGTALIYMQGELRAQNFWRLELATMNTRQLTRSRNATRCARSTWRPTGSASSSIVCETTRTSC